MENFDLNHSLSQSLSIQRKEASRETQIARPIYIHTHDHLIVHFERWALSLLTYRFNPFLCRAAQWFASHSDRTLLSQTIIYDVATRPKTHTWMCQKNLSTYLNRSTRVRRAWTFDRLFSSFDWLSAVTIFTHAHTHRSNYHIKFQQHWRKILLLC